MRQASTSLRRSTFELPGMDCPSEERLVRMTIGNVPSVQDLAFDLHAHRLTAIHAGPAEDVLRLLAPLKLGARLAGPRRILALR